MAWKLPKRIREKQFSIYSIPWAFLLLMLSISILCIAMAYNLYAVYMILPGHLVTMNTLFFLGSAQIMGSVGFILLVITVVLLISKLLSKTKDPVKEDLAKIHKDSRNMAREIHELRMSLDNFVKSFQGVSNAQTTIKAKTDKRKKEEKGGKT
ncbi:MAG: hypothetical protein ABSB38_09280 [Dehalococcoidia bacterium]